MVWKGDARNRLAKSLVTLIDQIDQKLPSRDNHNDGTIGDEAHQKKGKDSDHNPHIRHGSKGVVTALDVTHDPAAGFDAGAFADLLRESKDPRIKYVIFDGRIFSSTIVPWVWRARGQGPGDHSEHVHVSVVEEPALYDDTKPWPLELSGVPAQAAASAPKLKLGDRGPAVVNLQNLLGIEADGVFGAETEQAVRAFQAGRNLFVDGVVGSHTWGLLTASPASPLGVAGAGDVGSLSPATMEQIVKLAGESDLAAVKWDERGVAPRGYTKGMALTFGQVYAKLKAGDPVARLMAAMSSGDDQADALSWYDSRFRTAGMDNSVSGAATLRHLFVLLVGLGMRESSGRYCEGRDMSADNVTADTAEAGLFQMSWNARAASPELPRLFAAYSAKPEGFLSTFQEGVTPKPSDLESFGTGEGVAFQRLCKSCPAFAVEAAGVGLRVLRKHWGPINRHEVEIRPEADRLLQQVQGVVDAVVAEPVPEPQPQPVPVPGPLPDIVLGKAEPLPGNLLLLILILAMLSKERRMADDPARAGQGTDLVKVLLPLLLQSMLTGKRIDIAELLSVLLTGKPVASPAITPVAAPSARQPTDLNALLLPLLYQLLTGKSLPGLTPEEPEKPVVVTPPPTATEPMMQKPSVQLSVAGLGLSSILQAIGTLGTPFGMGQSPTVTGTLATLVPILTGVFGATGGFGALLNIGRGLLGGIAGAANKPK